MAKRWFPAELASNNIGSERSACARFSRPGHFDETGLDKPKIVRLVIGSPLIMKEMAKHVPDAGSYAPVTVLVDERDDGVHLSYDRVTSLLAPYHNRNALEVARNLDTSVEDLLRQAAT